MIYIVIGKDNNTHDEWVRAETFYTAPEATQLCERLNKTRDDAFYRVETIDPQERRSQVKEALNRAFGRGHKTLSEMLYERRSNEGTGNLPVDFATPVFTMDAPASRTEDFSIDELFPQGTHVVAYTLTCSECSCEIKNVLQFLDAHTKWHNKLLP